MKATTAWILFGVLMIVGKECKESDQKEKTEKVKKEILSSPALDDYTIQCLVDMYKANPAAFKQNTEHTGAKIIGKVSTIETRPFGYNVIISTPNADFQCSFDDEKELASISTQQTITVMGALTGEVSSKEIVMEDVILCN